MNLKDFDTFLKYVEDVSEASFHLCTHKDKKVYAKACKINTLSHEMKKFLERRKPKD